jgi:protein subunit release factor A
MSAARITVPPPHPATLSEEALWKQVKFDRVRGSGPGGQRRNKVETGVELEHLPTGLRSIATERRSPEENRTRALFRLRLRLAVEVRVEHADETTGPNADSSSALVPSPLWQTRVREGRIVCNPTHHDFPALLAEALDAVVRYGCDVKFAAGWLGCTTSQLVKFLADEPPALARLNQERADRHMPPLR